MIKFMQTGQRDDGVLLYMLVIDDKVVRENLTIDEVIELIHREDEGKIRREARR